MKSIFNQDRVKTHSLRLAASTLLISLLVIQSCSKSDPKTKTDHVKEILTANTWNLQTVTVDDVDQTSFYTGMTLSFTNTGYFTVNGGLVWPAMGAWKFADNTGKVITRSDDLTVTIDEASTTKLVLKLMWVKTTLGGGRSASVRGEHVFVFGK